MGFEAQVHSAKTSQSVTAAEESERLAGLGLGLPGLTGAGRKMPLLPEPLASVLWEEPQTSAPLAPSALVSS